MEKSSTASCVWPLMLRDTTRDLCPGLDTWTLDSLPVPEELPQLVKTQLHPAVTCSETVNNILKIKGKKTQAYILEENWASIKTELQQGGNIECA